MEQQQQPERPRYEANFNTVDPYETLGLQGGATAREIKKAYFSLVREYPPEERPNEFKKIRLAYEQLRDPDKRAETDLYRFQKPAAYEPRKRVKKFDLAFSPAVITRLLTVNTALSEDEKRRDFRPLKL